jgi:hypothetical protein
MAETPNEILRQIETKREQLGQDITRLESYVREKTDVRKYYERNPWPFVGGAALGGMFLAMIFMPDARRPRERRRVRAAMVEPPYE